MATVQYICDACDATFEVDTVVLAEQDLSLMCPECGETEILRVAGLSIGSCCETVPGTKSCG
jgi:predicted RNA-binding Zn-ribbon protein involved in translation (DUF1610 family)